MFEFLSPCGFPEECSSLVDLCTSCVSSFPGISQNGDMTYVSLGAPPHYSLSLVLHDSGMLFFLHTPIAILGEPTHILPQVQISREPLLSTALNRHYVSASLSFFISSSKPSAQQAGPQVASSLLPFSSAIFLLPVSDILTHHLSPSFALCFLISTIRSIAIDT